MPRDTGATEGPKDYTITLTLVDGFVDASPIITNARVNDHVIFRSADGRPLRIVFLNGRSPFRNANAFRASGSQRRKCVKDGAFNFLCQLQKAGSWVTYQVGNAGGDLNVGK
jgi:hypothetical protein